jgi:hypothetical protein
MLLLLSQAWPLPLVRRAQAKPRGSLIKGRTETANNKIATTTTTATATTAT